MPSSAVPLKAATPSSHPRSGCGPPLDDGLEHDGRAGAQPRAAAVLHVLQQAAVQLHTQRRRLPPCPLKQVQQASEQLVAAGRGADQGQGVGSLAQAAVDHHLTGGEV